MKNKLSTKEQKVLDDAFARLEIYINDLAKSERLSLDNIHMAIRYAYNTAIGEPCQIDFMQSILSNEKPMTDWSDIEEDEDERS